MTEDTLELQEISPESFDIDIKELDNEDVSKLLESSRNLLRQFIQDYPDELPSAVLLPDTSGRPLKYLLDPVLDKISSERGVEKPKFFFLKVKIPDSLPNIETTLDLTPGKESKKVDEFLLKQLKAGNSWSNEYVLSVRKEQRQRKKMRERAREVKSLLENTGVEPTFVIFDEYIAEGDTINEVRYAFDEKIPAYAFLGVPTGDTTIKIGSEDYRKEGSEILPTRGFDYRGTVGVGVTKKDDSSKYSKPLNPPDRIKITNLRSDMREIGKAIASSL